MVIRSATMPDFDAIWPIFKEIARAGETYAYPHDISKEAARMRWLELPTASYVAVDGTRVLGSYYLKPNQEGGGAHVCNAGYMVDTNTRGQGLGRMLCEHSQQEAVKLGFKAMQFNLVVSSNPAVRLWHALGFDTIGTLPKAFKHPKLGYVDAFVMYKWLGN